MQDENLRVSSHSDVPTVDDYLLGCVDVVVDDDAVCGAAAASSSSSSLSTSSSSDADEDTDDDDDRDYDTVYEDAHAAEHSTSLFRRDAPQDGQVGPGPSLEKIYFTIETTDSDAGEDYAHPTDTPGSSESGAHGSFALSAGMGHASTTMFAASSSHRLSRPAPHDTTLSPRVASAARNTSNAGADDLGALRADSLREARISHKGAFRRPLKQTEEIRSLRRAHLNAIGKHPSPASIARHIASPSLEYSCPSVECDAPPSPMWETAHEIIKVPSSQKSASGQMRHGSPTAPQKRQEPVAAAEVADSALHPTPPDFTGREVWEQALWASMDASRDVTRAIRSLDVAASMDADDGDSVQRSSQPSPSPYVSPVPTPPLEPCEPPALEPVERGDKPPPFSRTMNGSPETPVATLSATSASANEETRPLLTRQRSATAPDVVARSLVAAAPTARRNSCEGDGSSSGGGRSGSRPSSATRRAGAGVRFIKAARAPNPFVKPGEAPVSEGSQIAPDVPQRSPLAPLLLSVFSREPSNTVTSFSSPHEHVVKVSHISFRDRITTLEERRTARAHQSPAEVVDRQPPRLHAVSRTTSEGSVSASNTAKGESIPLLTPLTSIASVSATDDNDEYAWFPIIPAPAPLAPRTQCAPQAPAAGANESDLDASAPDVVPTLMLPPRAVTGKARTKTHPTTAAAAAAAGPHAKWKTTASETGEERIVYAGDCILPQVLRDHHARVQHARQCNPDQAAAAVRPPPLLFDGEVIRSSDAPSPLRWQSEAAAPTSTQHWSPIAPSALRKRGSPAPTSSTPTTSSATADSGAASPSPHSRPQRSLPAHAEHILSLSSSLTMSSGQAESTPKSDMDRRYSAPASITTKRRTAGGVVSPPPSSPGQPKRWSSVPLPALPSPAKAGYRAGERDSNSPTFN